MFGSTQKDTPSTQQAYNSRDIRPPYGAFGRGVLELKLNLKMFKLCNSVNLMLLLCFILYSVNMCK